MKQTLTKEDVFAFLQTNRLAVLATCSTNSFSHTATMYYIVDGDRLLFISGEKTQKVTNLDANPSVSFAMFDEQENVSLSYKGNAKKSEMPVSEYLIAIEKKLKSKDKAFIDLPVLQHKGMKRFIYEVEPTEITMRKYFSDYYAEKVLTFSSN